MKFEINYVRRLSVPLMKQSNDPNFFPWERTTNSDSVIYDSLKERPATSCFFFSCFFFFLFLFDFFLQNKLVLISVPCMFAFQSTGKTKDRS